VCLGWGGGGGGGGSAETGNPRPVLYENSSIAQSLQRGAGDDLPGG